MTLRLILNADDFGYEPAITEGIALSMRKGLVSSATMVVNSPWSEEAALEAQGLAIGLHLNLVRFSSLSEPGYELGEHLPLDVDFVMRETQAQLSRMRSLLGRDPTHIDVHKHAHRRPEVLEALCRVAAEYSMPVRSIDTAMRASLRAAGVRTNDFFVGEAGAEPYWTCERWALQLDALPHEGVVELMCHPGRRPTQLASSYGAQREVELATFLAPASKEALLRRGLTLSSWAGV